MFYVYVYRDPRLTKNRQPVYVGKGSGARDLSHWARGSHNKPLQDFLSHLRRQGLEPICERVFESINEQEAFTKERELITLYGRRDLRAGPLFNRTDGGEGVCGYIKTAEQKLVDKHGTELNWRNPGYRAKVIAAQKIAQGTPEARARKSKHSQRMWSVKKEELSGKIKQGRSTDASRAKTSTQAKQQWADPEYAAKQSANNKEIANREEVKAAKKAAAKALWADPIWREKMMAARGKKH